MIYSVDFQYQDKTKVLVLDCKKEDLAENILKEASYLFPEADVYMAVLSEKCIKCHKGNIYCYYKEVDRVVLNNVFY